RHYRGRDFYRDRDRWDRGGRGPDRDRGGWDRDRRDRDRGDWDRGDWDRRDRDRRDWDRDWRDGDRSDWRGDGDRDGSRQVGVITSPDGQVCFVGEERCLRRD
ncbi:hypothetical protein, partial [Pseudorhizobium marinum]